AAGKPEPEAEWIAAIRHGERRTGVVVVDEDGLPLAGVWMAWTDCGVRRTQVSNLFGEVEAPEGASLTNQFDAPGDGGPGPIKGGRSVLAGPTNGAPMARETDLIPEVLGGAWRVEGTSPPERWSLGPYELIGVVQAGRTFVLGERVLIALDANHLVIEDSNR